MANQSLDTQVLIVGAGPVGLFLANECARRAIPCRIIEERATQSLYSKALAIFPRTLEIFDMAGVAAPFLEAANRVTSVKMISHGHLLAHMHFEPKQTPYPFVAMVPQDVTEKLLVEQLQRRGGKVEYETTFVSGEQTNEFATATIEQAGQTKKITASFVIGCDGAHSAVRRGLNIPFEGGDYPDSFALADVETNDALPANELQLCPNESGPLAIFPMSATRRRIIATIDQPQGDQPQGDAPSLALIQKLLAQRGPAGIEARSLNWGGYFRIHHRHVGQLRAGRFFLAGDAAHIHSPFGGQGMNTGLHDVWNLGWKLDLFLRGHGNDELLDSYGAERLPVIRSVIDTTDQLTKIMSTPSKFAQLLRDAIIPMVSRLAPFQHAFVNRLSELGIAYHGSPIVEGPGNRYLEDSMRAGGMGSRFLLLVGHDQDDAIREAAQRLHDSMPDVVELRATQHSGITLVRPDGYVAYAARSNEGGSVFESALSHLRDLLQRQTKPRPAAASAKTGHSAAF